MPKTLFYKDSDVCFEYEVEGKDLLLHCEVVRWSPSILKKSYTVFGDFLNTMRKAGFERACTITPNPKFAKVFGGKEVATYEHEGKEYEVVIWELV